MVWSSCRLGSNFFRACACVYSSIEIRKALETIIDSEDKAKPLTDEELKKALNQRGYPVARRTVAKYRDIIGAPVARLRKKL